MENLAKTTFENITGLTLEQCGLFIDKHYSYLAVSPGYFYVYLIKIFIYKYKYYIYSIIICFQNYFRRNCWR